VASPNSYFSGIGGTSGASLATASPLLTSGYVWYVSSSIGVNGSSPAGRERNKPIATLAQAITNASAGDTIVFLSGHSETLGAGQTIGTAGLTLVGEGTGSSRPKFTRNVDAVLFDITAAGVWLDNLYFVESALASTAARVKTNSANTRLTNCYLESGANDTGPAFNTVTGASQVGVLGTTFISVAPLLTAQPASAITITNAITDLELDTVIFDGGTSGWSNPFAFVGTGAITRLRALDVDLLKDSDMTFATGTSGYLAVRNTSGSAKVVWAA